MCEQLLCLMRPSDQKKATVQKVLDAPINLAEMAANAETTSTDVSSIWVVNRDDNLVGSFDNFIFTIITVEFLHFFRLGNLLSF